jgi:signal transduction histidine kinase
LYAIRDGHSSRERAGGNERPGASARRNAASDVNFYNSHTSLVEHDFTARDIVLVGAPVQMISIVRDMRVYGARPLLLGAALLGIVVVSALAVRDSMANARERKAAAERTIKDYAMFASYIYTSRAYLFARDRTLFQAYLPVHPSDPWVPGTLPPASVLAAVPDTTERCGPSGNWPIYRFRVMMPARTVTYAGARPDAQIDAIIRDSIPKLAVKPWVRGARFGYLFVDAPAGREAVSYAPAYDSANRLLAVYGYRSCYGVRDTSDYSIMYKVVRVMPPQVPGYMDSRDNSAYHRTAATSATSGDASDSETIREKWPSGMPAESLLTLTITDMQDRELYKAPKTGPSSEYHGVAALGFIGGTIFSVALRPEVAQYLVVGGIPESRIPASMLLLVASVVLAIAGFASLRSEIRLVQSRQKFLANVSHELRTPLQQILMFVQLLRLGRTRSDSERERSLEIIETETHRLIALSDSVLAAAKAETQLNTVPVDVSAVVRTAADFFAPLAQARKMSIRVDVPGPVVASGNSDALRQILINVLDNAAKYGPAGQTITIGARDEGKTVRLWVDDSGPGIPSNNRDEVWKPFVRLGGTVDDSTGGAGLGLAIVRDLATAMGAHVCLTEAPSGGSRFVLEMLAARNGAHNGVSA